MFQPSLLLNIHLLLHTLQKVRSTLFPPALKGHFRVPPGLCFKTRVGAQPLIRKSFFILMNLKLIFTRKGLHLTSFWKWGFLEHGSGLFALYLENFKMIRRLKIQTGVSIIFCLDVSYMFMCQGPVGPPGADGERGVDGSKVKSCIILLIIIVLSFDDRVCL